MQNFLEKKIFWGGVKKTCEWEFRLLFRLPSIDERRRKILTGIVRGVGREWGKKGIKEGKEGMKKKEGRNLSSRREVAPFRGHFSPSAPTWLGLGEQNNPLSRRGWWSKTQHFDIT
jgi:hypothetical protein